MQWLPFDLDEAPTIHPMEDVIERGHKKASLCRNLSVAFGFELHLAGSR